MIAIDARWIPHGSEAPAELSLIIAGTQEPPMVTNLDRGESTTLRRCRIDLSVGTARVVECSSPAANAWMGEVPVDPDATEAHLALLLDGQEHRATVRPPAQHVA